MIKKISIILIASVLLSFKTNDDKKLTVQLTTSEWQKHFNKLQAVRNYIDNSNLPHGDVKFIEGTIDSLMLDLAPQLQKQLQKDSTNKK